MAKTTIAVIGCGRISEMAHFPALSKNENVRIKYACDLIIEKAQDKVERFGAEQAITDYKIALADKEVEAVYVLTPNYAHYEITMDALRADKHVFCEKPITVSYKLSCEMAEEARKRGKLLNIGVCNRYHSTVETIEKLNREGKLGNIYHIYCSFRSFRSIPGLGGPFTTKAHSGGGVLIDWGVHFLDLILYALGGAKIRTVSADTYCEMAKSIPDYKFDEMWAGPPILDGTNDVDDFVTGHIRTDKATISFNGAWAQNVNEEEMFIDFLGDKGGIRMTYRKEVKLYVIEDGEFKTLKPELNGLNDYQLEDNDFIDAIKTGRITRNHIDSVLQSAKLLDMIYESAEKKRELVAE